MATHSKAVAVSSIYLNAYTSQLLLRPLRGPCSQHYGRSTLGRFITDWSAVRTREMDWTGLKLLLEGMEGKQVRKRYALPGVMKSL